MKRPFAERRLLGPFVSTGIFSDDFSDCNVIVHGTPLIDETGEYEESILFDGTVGETEIIEFNAEISGCRLSIDDYWVGGEGDSFIKYNYIISDGDETVGESWIIEEEDSLLMSHLLVQEEYRGTQVSDLFFDIFIEYGRVANVSNVRGSIGGGERTASFFEKMGVPADDIKLVERGPEGKSARFETDLDNIL